MVKCQSCGGTYEPVQIDGTQYFHACPPLSAVEVKTRLAANTLTLTDAQKQQLDAAKVFDRDHPAPADGVSALDQALVTIAIERPNKRDENVTKGATAGKAATIKSAGDGIQLLTVNGK